jgi:hypothetical protein
MTGRQHLTHPKLCCFIHLIVYSVSQTICSRISFIPSWNRELLSRQVILFSLNLRFRFLNMMSFPLIPEHLAPPLTPCPTPTDAQYTGLSTFTLWLSHIHPLCRLLQMRWCVFSFCSIEKCPIFKRRETWLNKRHICDLLVLFERNCD